MPSMANITVKASNGTTDVVYVAQTPSGGDSSLARWGVEAASAVPAFRPVFTSVASYNGNRSARRHKMSLLYPVTATENGILVLKGNVIFDVQATVPQNLDNTIAKEGYYQGGNLLVSTLIRGQLDSGFAPT